MRPHPVWALCLPLLLSACRPEPPTPLPPKAVAAAQAEALRAPVTLLLPAAARLESGAVLGGRRRDYRLDLELPSGTRAVARPGAQLEVLLPLVRHARAGALLLASQAGHLSLRLVGQVQELAGRDLQVQVGLQPAGLFIVPLGAVQSPRGLTAEVYALREGRAHSVPVQVLQLRDDGRLLVAGALRDGESVAEDGLDGLLEGDEVRLLPKEVEP